MCVLKLSSASRAVALNLFMRFHDARRTCFNNKEAFVIYLRLAGKIDSKRIIFLQTCTHTIRGFRAVERARALKPHKVQINYEREPELEEIKWN